MRARGVSGTTTGYRVRWWVRARRTGWAATQCPYCICVLQVTMQTVLQCAATLVLANCQRNARARKREWHDEGLMRVRIRPRSRTRATSAQCCCPAHEVQRERALWLAATTSRTARLRSGTSTAASMAGTAAHVQQRREQSEGHVRLSCQRAVAVHQPTRKPKAWLSAPRRKRASWPKLRELLPSFSPTKLCAPEC